MIVKRGAMMKPDIEARLAVLNRIFDVYENVTRAFETACDKGCATCCTRNVTLTTLEGYNILNNLEPQVKTSVLSLIETEIDEKRLIPEITINQMAKLSIDGKELPEEQNDPAWGQCPLLRENQCMIYNVRPFACRCMMSKSRCADSGVAEMDEYAVTLNNVFMQYIEHIDIGGCFGNLSDILLFTGNGEKETEEGRFIENQGVEMLMVPPEHQGKIRAVIQELQQI